MGLLQIAPGIIFRALEQSISKITNIYMYSRTPESTISRFKHLGLNTNASLEEKTKKKKSFSIHYKELQKNPVKTNKERKERRNCTVDGGGKIEEKIPVDTGAESMAPKRSLVNDDGEPTFSLFSILYCSKIFPKEPKYKTKRTQKN